MSTFTDFQYWYYYEVTRIFFLIKKKKKKNSEGRFIFQQKENKKELQCFTVMLLNFRVSKKCVKVLIKNYDRFKRHVLDNIVHHQLKLGMYKAGFYKVTYEYA